MKILIVGNGGREHALTWKIHQSPLIDQIFVTKPNAGQSEISKGIDIAPTDIDRLLDFATTQRIDLTVVGPEAPLAMGIVDRFESEGLLIYGPNKRAAQIETSKCFAKKFFAKNGIPTAEFATFSTPEDAKKFIRAHDFTKIVIKADGLAAGKGVIICDTPEKAIEAIINLMEVEQFGKARRKIVIEEFLEGEEISFIVMTDGKQILPLETARDYKRAYDSDKGPNTGGMGAYSPSTQVSPNLYEKVMSEIFQPTITGLQKKGITYKGTLFAGLILTKDGIKILEFNARFGDPETQALMVRLQDDIVPILKQIAEGHLTTTSLKWSPEPSVCIVMASEGYPLSYESGKTITGLDRSAHPQDVTIFHAGTQRRNHHIVTSGGRVLCVSAMRPTMKETIRSAYMACNTIHFDNQYFRHDIAREVIAE